MTALLEEQMLCNGCVLHTPPPFNQEMFPGFDSRLVGESVVAVNFRCPLGELFSSQEDPWVSGDITKDAFPIRPKKLLYFWVGYLTARSSEDVDLEDFRTLVGHEGKEGWHLGGIEHLFLIGRLCPLEVNEGSSIIGLREPGKIRGRWYWPRLMRGEGLSLVPHGGKKIAPATRVLIVHEGRI